MLTNERARVILSKIKKGSVQMLIKFKQFSLPLRKRQTSTLDHSFALKQSGNDLYWCFTDHEIHERYCVLKGNEIPWNIANRLDYGDEPRVIYGNLVRPMTFEEENLYMDNKLDELVDMFGNILLGRSVCCI